jgi:alpha-beta hydrolase superfamily lysophospholipase
MGYAPVPLFPHRKAQVHTAQFVSAAGDGAIIVYHVWPGPQPPRAVVVIAHGAAEHGLRYARFAAALNAVGYAVVAIDHRGHGETGKRAKLGVFADADGWNRAVADLHQLVEHVRAHHPGVPVVLFGHSMGSLMAQQYLAEHGANLAAAVLSGSTLVGGFADLVPLLAAEMAAAGRDAPSELMAAQMGGGFNAGIDDPQTPYDWLSRDAAEVQQYIDDPLCGFPLSCGAWHDMIATHRIPCTPAEFAQVPRELPLCVLAGDGDPLNQNLVALHELVRRYREAGLAGITELYYPGGRHEMLNETSREQVTADLLAWLDDGVRRCSHG